MNLFLQVSRSVTSFVSKYSFLNFRIVTLRDTLIQSHLVGKNAYAYESQKFEAFRYIRRHIHTTIFYLMS